jgi:uncharacterized secreted protein with C-terminal beta-propeller domain
MKANAFFTQGRILGFCFLFSVWFGTGIESKADLTAPEIESITLEGTHVVVTATVPKGIVSVCLESRIRLESGAWIPRVVQRINGNGGQVVFRVPMSAQLEVLRVRADASLPLPGFFYQGTNNYDGEPGSSQATTYREVDVATPGTGTLTSNEKTRDVVESDIWKIRGSTLFFFNQYRGLQVIDLAQPEKPVIRGVLELAASGEQMYVPDDHHVVLLARDNCSGQASQVLIVEVTEGQPEIITRLPIEGNLVESRMVGTALYVAAQSYQAILDRQTNQTWAWGTKVYGFDLSDPARPIARNSLWFNSGYDAILLATEQYMFIAQYNTANWRNSIVQMIDISAPDGTLRELGSLATIGRIIDKFKMNVTGQVFTTISEAWDEKRRFVTTLETFSLADPAKPLKLGQLELAAGEQLHATRFDGNKVYVVTFLRVDPLWVVDLSDAAHPNIVGELEIPGWSTYIQPLGDRLVTIGIDNSNGWRVAVSLFNVQNPAKPALISKVPLGDNYSWSEATYDEKAFSVLPESELILVPYQGQFTNGYASRVQLIDLKLNDLTINALVKRGAIDHQFQPRRATVFEDFILSVSGKELLSVDAQDRDHPVVMSTLELAWTVDQVFLSGSHLIQIEKGNRWDSTADVAIRVSTTADPAAILRRITLTNGGPVIGAHRKDNRLYLVQYANTDWMMPVLIDESGKTVVVTNPPILTLSIYDLAPLPNLELLGQTRIEFDPSDPIYDSALQPLWPKPNLLVWSGSGYGMYYGGMLLDGAMVRNSLYWSPWGLSGNGRFLAFDVADPTTPALLSHLNLATNNWWSYSQAVTADGKVYFSHQSSEFIEGFVKPGYTVVTSVIKNDPDTGKPITNQVTGTWMTKWYLDVVDYADPRDPTMRKPVNLPGRLIGVSHGGVLLYTQGNRWENGVTDWLEWIDASAYDGVSASLIDSLPLPKEWPRPTLVYGTNILLGRPASETNKMSSLETWSLSSQGRFINLGMFPQDSPVDSFKAFDSLLVTRSSDAHYRLLNPTDPSRLILLGEGDISGCVWPGLEQADGEIQQGLALPLGDFGATFIPVKP